MPSLKALTIRVGSGSGWPCSTRTLQDLGARRSVMRNSVDAQRDQRARSRGRSASCRCTAELLRLLAEFSQAVERCIERAGVFADFR